MISDCFDAEFSNEFDAFLCVDVDLTLDFVEDVIEVIEADKFSQIDNNLLNYIDFWLMPMIHQVKKRINMSIS